MSTRSWYHSLPRSPRDSACRGQPHVWVRVRSSSVFSVFSILDLSVCWTDRWHGLGCCAAIVLVLVLSPQGPSRGNQETRTLDQFEISSTRPSSHQQHRIRVHLSSLYRNPWLVIPFVHRVTILLPSLSLDLGRILLPYPALVAWCRRI